ncbi:MAG: 6-pyruvoyl tetrahydropterin synthase family protein [Phycisphaerales bacterium]|nr:6-pyruvoyl tetrahydropterin synthase family protein [Phycisphaerales bacterium]
MFEISVTRTFCASHQVRFADGTLEPMHGHNWTVTVSAGAEELDADGFVIDFHQLELRLDAILKPLNNAHLNDAKLLAGRNPSAEIVCQAIGQAIQIDPPARLLFVSITEAPGCVATYRPSPAPQPNFADLNG